MQKRRRILRIASSEEQGAQYQNGRKDSEMFFYLFYPPLDNQKILLIKEYSRLLCPAASAASVQTAACKPSAAAVQTISAGKKTEQMVWVPTHGGKKYHSKSTCSNMKDPEKVTLSKAKAEGFTACKKCY